MKRSTILTIIASLLIVLIGGACGYGTGYIIYEPKIRSYETQVSDLTFQVSALTSQVSDLTSEVSRLSQTVSSQESQISSQETQILALESERSRLQSDLAEAQETIASYEWQATALKSQVSNLQERLDNIFGITVTQYYQWVYEWQTWYWELPIPLSLYVEYLERQRPPLVASYVDMAKDPKDDPQIDKMVQQINSAAIENGFTESEKVNFVIAFVQSLPYTVDKETTPYDEYPRYPIETLFDRGGDCEDTSILVAALLDRMGYDVAILHLQNAQHMAVGISISGNHGTYYEYDNKKYFYLETTGEGWEIGVIPSSITETTAHIYPVSS